MSILRLSYKYAFIQMPILGVNAELIYIYPVSHNVMVSAVSIAVFIISSIFSSR